MTTKTKIMIGVGAAGGVALLWWLSRRSAAATPIAPAATPKGKALLPGRYKLPINAAAVAGLSSAGSLSGTILAGRRGSGSLG